MDSGMFFRKFDELGSFQQPLACDYRIEGENARFGGVVVLGGNCGESRLYIDSGTLAWQPELEKPLHDMTLKEIEEVFPEVSDCGVRRVDVVRLWEESQTGTGDDLSPRERVRKYYRERQQVGQDLC
jgi:hypothetical protein